MTRSELRIGNIIDRGDYHCKVTSITEDGIMTEPINYEGERFVEQITKPIPLTEEWLVKFGFETNDWTDKGKTVYVGYVKEELMLQGTIKNLTLDGGGFDIKIKHLHQLQNLYFALTGKELEI
jgi:hypothetical protein